jgi:hypothetical protein
MDTIRAQIFSDQVSELNALSLSTIDLTDTPLSASILPSNLNNPNLLVTSPVVAHGYYELEFMLANNFWGIPFQFGNNPNGVQLRQGIAHLINKAIFNSSQGDISGLAHVIDNPVPAGIRVGSNPVTTPNSCNWDLNFTEAGGICTQAGGPPGGIAYNCAAAGITAACPVGTIVGTVNYPWQPQIGSPDFCAAAAHFITAFRHAGIGNLQENANCVLLPPAGQSTFPAAITSNPVDFMVRTDHHPRLEMGTSIAQEVCGLWTGALTTGCNFPGTTTPAVTVHPGIITSFCGLTTSTTGVNPCWWIYTAGFSSVFPIDRSLYFTYNSRFVSGVCTGPTNCITTNPTFGSPGTCSINSIPTPAASNYIFLCNPAYDTASNNLEFAPDIGTASSQATNAMDIFGKGAFTIPIWTDTIRMAYLNGWTRVLNTDGAGIFPATQFTWLNDYNPTPAVIGTARQGFSQTTRSLSPYIAVTQHDQAIVSNVFDSVLIENPLNYGQFIDWMTTSHSLLPSSQLGYPQCAAPPLPPVQPCYPASATQNLRLNLRSDIFFQDGHQLTGFDVKFAYSTLAANGAAFGTALSPMSCARATNGTILFNCNDGITVKSKNVVDIHLDSFGPFTSLTVGTTIVFPGRYWSQICPGFIWDIDAAMGDVPDSCMTLDLAKTSFSYDPIANHILVGSGPWECADVLGGSGAVGFGCSDTGAQNPPVNHTYTLTRYGKGHLPASSATAEYFRSNGALALYLWSGPIGDTAQDIITGSILQGCNRPTQPPPILGQTSGCGHWQQGIGQLNGLGPVGQSQVNIYQRFLFVDWVAPFTWAAPPCQPPASGPISCTGLTHPMDGMHPLPGSTLYEGPYSLYPAAVVGCGNIYDATKGLSSGGYDC